MHFDGDNLPASLHPITSSFKAQELQFLVAGTIVSCITFIFIFTFFFDIVFFFAFVFTFTVFVKL